MGLIDADKLHYHRVWIASIKKGEYNGMKSAVVVFADEIDKNKTARVDAEPVVRCRDCEYWNPYKSHHYKGHFCDVVTLFVKENEYCAWGKRKGGADDGE